MNKLGIYEVSLVDLPIFDSRATEKPPTLGIKWTKNSAKEIVV
jgi:hypothetical protein